MKLLIDADYIVYKSCQVCETEIDFGDDIIVVTSRFSEAYKQTVREIKKIESNFFDIGRTILFFSDSVNFRKSIFPDYKGHRNRKKPCGYRRVINELKKEYEVIKMPTLEADDAMGIYATLHADTVICSPDKDMRQIPGKLYDLDELKEITPDEGRQWHYIQTLAGDQTDGYSGVPGIGVKRAIALFDEHGYNWTTVVKAFKEKGLEEDVALMNARLAKILTCDDYDLEHKRPLLWTPTDASGDVDDGAGLPVSKDTRSPTGSK
jgi:DNA polymerase-1